MVVNVRQNLFGKWYKFHFEYLFNVVNVQVCGLSNPAYCIGYDIIQYMVLFYFSFQIIY